MPKFLCDLHMHSCLSPCADSEMTPYNLVNMAKVMELDMIALTDHNSSLNCPAAMQVAAEAGISLVPGMELTTAEEVHVVCLFESLEGALGFSEYVAGHMPKIKNRLDLFGEQMVMDARDGVLCRYEHLLAVAGSIGINAAESAVRDFSGVCYPAHIDRPSFSLISNLGGFSPEMGFLNAELSRFADEQKLCAEHPALRGMRRLRASDAHCLENVGSAAVQLELPENSARALVRLLREGINGDFTDN